MDGIEECDKIVGKGYCGEWILEGEIKGCFEDMRDEWLVGNMGMDKGIVGKWLKCGYVLKKEMLGREEGRGEGGIICGRVGNMSLEGLEKGVGDRYKGDDVNGKLY